MESPYTNESLERLAPDKGKSQAQISVGERSGTLKSQKTDESHEALSFKEQLFKKVTSFLLKILSTLKLAPSLKLSTSGF
ncbi:MAG: hypothetical protein A3C84_03030 [Candidatus Ryanbacteria bacterium RIFCSPHIGHO2_02_FULL_48_12]|uniref:Uncharacterized protein n=1 Tax=Candidatus Ryanbacteria bacterium RIFCSPHIGHO2_01_FULL_48_27 TaxID=1802115 RepID=A0A1G2G510_9BACT|nr:MAG: hypothetical protein A2756_01500 [Candidatus Ryanbacteria bacterium RIFCSPHIGHO2_01_FULL_48_27]OGZ49074.1 MAG: hypothetical protein A3C84_03030 [Candidatus Ryanbacteria bacterium RIFCSPHIGHO2_02_FULL_48_12]